MTACHITWKGHEAAGMKHHHEAGIVPDIQERKLGPVPPTGHAQSVTGRDTWDQMGPTPSPNRSLPPLFPHLCSRDKNRINNSWYSLSPNLALITSTGPGVGAAKILTVQVRKLRLEQVPASLGSFLWGQATCICKAGLVSECCTPTNFMEGQPPRPGQRKH